MSDIETALRESLQRHAAGAPDAVPATPELLMAVRRRRSMNSALLCVATVVAVLAVALGTKLVASSSVEPAPPPEPRLAPALAYVGTGGSIWARAADGSTSLWVGNQRLRDLCGVPCFPSKLEWSPDGRTLAVLTGPACCLDSTDVSVLVMSPGGEDVRRLFQCPDAAGCSDGLPRSLAWSSDAHQIAFSTNHEMYVVPLDGGPPDLVCTCQAAGLSFLPDGRLSYTADGAVNAVDLSSRETSTLATVKDATDATWSPDGRYAVVTTKDTFLSVVDFSVSPPAPVEPQQVDGLFVRWSPSGDRFVFVASTGHKGQTIRNELWIATPGQQPELLHRFQHVDGGLAPPLWSPDGSTVEFFQGSGMRPDGTVWLINATTGDVVDTLTGAQGGAAWQLGAGR